MSKQIQRLMAKHPNILYSVSYEGNGVDEYGSPYGDGTWLYMRPGWYCRGSETGSIHEHSIAEVVYCWKHAYQDKERWISEHPTEPDEHAKIRNGEYDLRGSK